MGFDWFRGVAALSLLIVPASCIAPAATSQADKAEAKAMAESQIAPAPAAAVVAAPVPMPVPAAALTDFDLNGAAIQGGVMIGRVPAGTRGLTLDERVIPVSADGRFLIAFDRDAGTGAHLVATRDRGAPVERWIPVAAGKWRIENINAPYRGSAGSDAEFARRRPAELEQINAARRIKADSDGWRQKFIWPVTGRLSGFFGSQRVYQGKPGSYHSGTDVAVPTGTPFVAPADGVVTLAATTPFTLEGYLLIVDHGMGLSSAFLHCNSLQVKVGDRVTQGQRLGTVGATGRATGPHMHWGLRWNDARLDPGTLAGPMTTRP